MTGGFGFDGVYNFYKNHFIGRLPDDIKIVRISMTVGKDQVVDELIHYQTEDNDKPKKKKGMSSSLFNAMVYSSWWWKLRGRYVTVDV